MSKLPKMSRPEKREVSLAKDKERNVDFSLLSDEKKKEITKLAEELLLERDRKEAEDAFLEAERARLDAELHPEIVEEMREIIIDVPEFCDGIRLDGRFYPHGWRGEVKVGVYNAMQEIMYRSRCHDDEVNGRNERARSWRRNLFQRGTEISGASGSVTTGNAPRF